MTVTASSSLGHAARRRRPSPPPELRVLAPAPAGFTLLEILIALAVLGLLLTLLGQGTSFGLWAADLQRRAQSDGGTELAAADALLRRLIADADPGLFPEPAPLRGTARSLSFVTTMAGADGARRRIDAEIVAGGGRLRLRWRTHRHVDGAEPPPLEDAVLLDGIGSLRIAYAAPGRAEWQAGWTGDALPGLVRLEIGFLSPRRHWPPIVAAPLLEAAGQ